MACLCHLLRGNSSVYFFQSKASGARLTVIGGGGDLMLHIKNNNNKPD